MNARKIEIRKAWSLFVAKKTATNIDHFIYFFTLAALSKEDNRQLYIDGQLAKHAKRPSKPSTCANGAIIGHDRTMARHCTSAHQLFTYLIEPTDKWRKLHIDGRIQRQPFARYISQTLTQEELKIAAELSHKFTKVNS